MKPRLDLLWAVGINGVGSSLVTFAFIKRICMMSSGSEDKVTIIYSARSTLDSLISPFLADTDFKSSFSRINFVRCPALVRNYVIHFLIKAIFNPLLLFKADKVVVFDDFPFRFATKQVLYFHQPNLIYNDVFVWRIKRLAFRLLLSPTLIVYTQTSHMCQAFQARFGYFRSLCFLHESN